MNYRGSYRKLLGNAREAIISAIEIYNKPSFRYRDECFVILLLNAWELMLKALLSKQGESIFYPKKRKQPYKTLSWQDALAKAEKFFPKEVPALPVRKNLEFLGTYRDNSVHFYNTKGFGSVLYALAQTSIVNFRDLLESMFDVDLKAELTWHLIPLGMNPPVDPLAYLRGSAAYRYDKNRAVDQFLIELNKAVKEVQSARMDTGRLLTIFTVNLQSTKKIDKADIVVGVKKASEIDGPLTIVKTQDPNVSHPLRRDDVVEEIGSLHGRKFTSYGFEAIAWKHGLKNKPQYCWRAKEGVLTKYSQDLIGWYLKLTDADVEAALKDYRNHLRSRARRSK